MNQRIKELADQAGFIRFSPKEDPHTPIDWSCEYSMELNQFAKLIAKECAEIASDVGTDTVPTDFALDKCYEIESKIKKHFGVEE